jgi:hypothetical protein
MNLDELKLALKILAPDPKKALRNLEELLKEADVRARLEADFPRSETYDVFGESFAARLPGPIERSGDFPKHFVDLIKTLGGQETEHYVLFSGTRFLQCLLGQDCLLGQKHITNSLRRRLLGNHLKWLKYNKLRVYQIAGKIVIPVETIGVYALVEQQRMKSEARKRKRDERIRKAALGIETARQRILPLRFLPVQFTCDTSEARPRSSCD